jgi:hypothetical protein
MLFEGYQKPAKLGNNNVDFAVENPRKLKEKPHKKWPRSEDVTTAIEKIQAMTHPLLCFFAAEGP